METKIIYNFLQKLIDNNSMDWMKSNKNFYNQAKNEFDNLIIEIVNGIRKFDNSIILLPPKDYMFKLNRDTRFSHDKSPYNPSFRAHISKAGKNPIPVGYFIKIQPSNTFLGGGLFASMFTDATKSIRDYMQKNDKKFIEIIETKNFRENFTIDGEKLKKVPIGYNSEHKLAEYIKYKSWYLEYKVKDNVVLNKNDFIKASFEIFELMKPFNDYLNKALKDFKIPERR
jgi:uncharacterized protein (TIGR02453 family)